LICRSLVPKISGKTPLAQAIRYALGRMPKARTYLSNGMLEPDNNICEWSIRPIALGRKNYLFMGSVGGGKAAAIAYTLIETAKMNSVDPEAWLTWVLNTSPIIKSIVSTNSCPGTGRQNKRQGWEHQTDTALGRSRRFE
jgi:transposase